MLLSIFIVPFLAFLLVVLGARTKKLITFCVFTLLILVGMILGTSLYFPRWAQGSAVIYSQFRGHTTERILSRIGVEIGVRRVNVTLRFERLMVQDPLVTKVDMSQLYYNEGFDITGVSSMAEALNNAYRDGLPYPMLTVLQYFSLNQDSFDWGRHYRVAGHYTSAAVWFSIACWGISCLLLILLPHCFYLSILATGFSAILACFIYWLMSPCELRIYFIGENLEKKDLTVTFASCFYLVAAAGLICVISGISLLILNHLGVYTLSTFLDSELDEDVAPKKKTKLLLELSEVVADDSSRPQTAKNKMKMIDEHHDGSSGFQSMNSMCTSKSSSLESVHTDENGECSGEGCSKILDKEES